MEDDDDNSGGGGGGGEMSLFEAFSTKAKATRTLGTYNDKNRKLVKFATGSDEFKAKVDLSKDLNRQITLPLTVELIKSFFNYVVRKENGNLLSPSSISSYKSAMMHLYDQNDQTMPADEAKALSTFKKGFVRVIARKKMDGEIKSTDGKDYLRVSDLCKLSFIFINHGGNGRSSQDQMLFLMCWSFLLLQWNLIQRVNTISDTTYDAFDYVNDHAMINIEQMKNDQSGDKAYKRALFSNLSRPDICWCLAFAVYFFSSNSPHTVLDEDRTVGSRKVFHKGDDRFSAALLKELKSKKHQFEAANFGDTGSHSIRKGAVTYANGLVGGANSIAVLLRGGWQINATLDQYILAGLGQDEMCGRELSQLFEWNKQSSAQLPAHFLDSVVNWERIIIDGRVVEWSSFVNGYESLPTGFKRCLPFFLARICYSFDYLIENFPGDSVFFKSQLWMSGLVQKLKEFVRSGLFEDVECSMTATGVPVNVMSDRRVEETRDLVKTGFDQLPTRIVEECNKHKCLNTEGAPPATVEDIRRIVSSEFSKVSSKSSITTTDQATSDYLLNPSISKDPIHKYYWGNSWHPVPEGFFKKNARSIELRHIWDCWWPAKLRLDCVFRHPGVRTAMKSITTTKLGRAPPILVFVVPLSNFTSIYLSYIDYIAIVIL